MRKQIYLAVTMFAAMAMVSCNNVEETVLQADEANAPAAAATRAYGDKAPKIMVYVETNDINPLNALSYDLTCGDETVKFIDQLQIFAANIHKDGDGDPTIYFNQELAPIMADVDKYIRPLQDAGMKVCLTTLGDWQGIGVANMDKDQADIFTNILAFIVEEYGLDGINFDDEYSNYSYYVSGSWARIIEMLRAKLGPDKLIGAFQWGNYSQIDAAAGAMLDHADHGSFGANVFQASSSISGVTNDRWMPQAINLGNTYNTLTLNQIKTRSAQAAAGGYYGIMMFNMRANDRSPLPVFNAIAEGAYPGCTVTHNGTWYSQDQEFIPGGYEITKNDID